MDMTIKYDNYAFLGNEFLTWMWFSGETVANFPFAVGKKIFFTRFANGEPVEIVGIKGEESELIVGKVAMSEGAIVTEIELIYSSDDPRYTFTLKGAELSFRGLKVPETIKADGEEDTDAAILENMFLINEIETIVDKAYRAFIIERMSAGWSATVDKIKLWINEG